MRVVIQRVKRAEVEVDHKIVGKIGLGLLLFIGITDDDGHNDIQWMAKKIMGLRLFDDLKGIMNLSIKDVGGELLIISQFTLFASTRKGNRPSYLRSAKQHVALPIYNKFIDVISEMNAKTEKGIFGAQMNIQLVNSGPVTITIDSKRKE